MDGRVLIPAGMMAAGLVSGLLAEAAYVPYMALAAVGLVICLVCRQEAPQPTTGYVVLGACVLLGISTYADAKQILSNPDIVGVVCMVAGMVGLAVVARWAVSRTLHAPPMTRV